MESVRAVRGQEGRLGWEFLLLDAVARQGQVSELQDIYEEIEPQVSERLLAVDHRWGERPIYQHTVRGILSNMVKSGLLERKARGLYAVTERGWARLS